jgi:hypothetical protein
MIEKKEIEYKTFNDLKRCLDIMAHALGGKDPTGWFRNHFVSGEECDNYTDLRFLEKNGLMERIKTPLFCAPEDIVFIVTEKGKGLFR